MLPCARFFAMMQVDQSKLLMCYSGRIRSFFPVVYREKMNAFSSDGKASLALGCQ